MTPHSRRLIIALGVLLSGLALLPQASLFAGAFSWQRFAGAYEDVVTVTRARYRADNDGGRLDVDALNVYGGAAVLTVYRTSDNLLFGPLSWNGSTHTRRFTNVGPSPWAITVRSSLGGETTVLVSGDSGPPVTVTPSGPTRTPTPLPPTLTPSPIPPTLTASPIPPTGTPTATAGPPTITPTLPPEGPKLFLPLVIR